MSVFVAFVLEYPRKRQDLGFSIRLEVIAVDHGLFFGVKLDVFKESHPPYPLYRYTAFYMVAFSR